MAKRKSPYKTFYIVILIVIVIFVTLTYSGILGAGSYPYRQDYKFNVSRDSLIKVLNSFKNHNSQYRVPKNVGVEDGFDNDRNDSIFYHSYLYYHTSNAIIHLVITEEYGDTGKSTIGLDAINEGLQLGHWRTINNDIARSENLKIKKKFTTEILDKLKLSYKDDGNSMLIFWK